MGHYRGMAADDLVAYNVIVMLRDYAESLELAQGLALCRVTVHDVEWLCC